MSNQKPLSREQLSAVSALPGPERFAHFVKRIADSELVWGLRDKDGWVSICDDDGNNGIPFWPHSEYANACARDEWSGYESCAVDVHEFVDTWLPNLLRQGVSVAVFPTTNMKGVFVNPLQLRAAIEDELKLYE